MPTQVNFMSWNIRWFASNGVVGEQVRGENSAFLVKFMAAVAQWQGINVLAIMELHPPNGDDAVQQALVNLRGALGSQWSFDSIRGAIADGVPDPLPAAADKHSLAWMSTANYEGYALLWSDDVPVLPAGIPVSEGVEGPALASVRNALMLSTEGRPTSPNGQPTGGFDPKKPSTFAMEPSRYPLTGDGNVKWSGSRRPAVFRIGTPGAPALQVSVFHAPSTPYGAGWGTHFNSLASELYLASPDEPVKIVAAAGDFNVDYSDNSVDYAYFTAPYDANSSAAGAATSATDALPSILKPPPLDAPPPDFYQPLDNYLGRPIDLIFYKATMPVFSGARKPVPLLEALMSPTDFVSAALKEYRVDTRRTFSAVGVLTDPSRVRAQLKQGYFTVPGDAAQFLYRYISDHLPVVISAKW